jgi:hypothetical protein
METKGLIVSQSLVGSNLFEGSAVFDHESRVNSCSNSLGDTTEFDHFYMSKAFDPSDQLKSSSEFTTLGFMDDRHESELFTATIEFTNEVISFVDSSETFNQNNKTDWKSEGTSFTLTDQRNQGESEETTARQAESTPRQAESTRMSSDTGNPTESETSLAFGYVSRSKESELQFVSDESESLLINDGTATFTVTEKFQATAIVIVQLHREEVAGEKSYIGFIMSVGLLVFVGFTFMYFSIFQLYVIDQEMKKRIAAEESVF